MHVTVSEMILCVITQSCILVQSLHKVQNEGDIRSVTTVTLKTTDLVLAKDGSNTRESSLVVPMVTKARHNQV
jgi:hypothetical protein